MKKIKKLKEWKKEWAKRLYKNGNCSKEWRDRFINQLNINQ